MSEPADLCIYCKRPRHDADETCAFFDDGMPEDKYDLACIHCRHRDDWHHTPWEPEYDPDRPCEIKECNCKDFEWTP